LSTISAPPPTPARQACRHVVTWSGGTAAYFCDNTHFAKVWASASLTCALAGTGPGSPYARTALQDLLHQIVFRAFLVRIFGCHILEGRADELARDSMASHAILGLGQVGLRKSAGRGQAGQRHQQQQCAVLTPSPK
jgi:hypothetical protein